MGTVEGISLIPASIYFCCSLVQASPSAYWGAAAFLFASSCSFLTFSIASFRIWSCFSFWAMAASLLACTPCFCYSWISLAFAMTSFWFLVPMKSAITRHLSFVPGGNFLIPSVNNATSSLSHFSFFLASEVFLGAFFCSSYAYSFFSSLSRPTMTINSYSISSTFYDLIASSFCMMSSTSGFVLNFLTSSWT